HHQNTPLPSRDFPIACTATLSQWFSPWANFLDVGGGATKERVAEALKIILSDDKVKGILVNIFGGIVRCDLIAEGIIAAVAEVKISVPIVVRLEGTKAAEGTDLLNNSGLNLIAARDLGEAATKIVAAVGEAK
ncbi:MAG: hypothetical protein ACE1ZB_04835, partial [Gammaproteobacteria bacterium]